MIHTGLLWFHIRMSATWKTNASNVTLILIHVLATWQTENNVVRSLHFLAIHVHPSSFGAWTVTMKKGGNFLRIYDKSLGLYPIKRLTSCAPITFRVQLFIFLNLDFFLCKFSCIPRFNAFVCVLDLLLFLFLFLFQLSTINLLEYYFRKYG